MSDMEYLAIDPGKRTGWAAFNELGLPTAFDMIEGEDEFLDWLEEQNPKKIIIERYRNRGGRINGFSDMPTSQHIGAIKRIARKKGVEIIEQDPSPALVIGLKFLGLHSTYQGKHVPDKISALAHGTYYLRKAGIQK